MARYNSPATRRYPIRLAVLMTAYILLLLLAKYMVKRDLAEGALLWILAILPALPIIGMFWAIGRLLIEETDEYVRSQLVRQLLIGSAVTLSVATVYGFLENFGLVGHVDAFYLTILFFVGMGVGAAVNRLAGQSGGGC
ncbi:MAG: hypothetical protein ABIW16_04720 [Sphingomicrobium sp.]